MDMEHAVRALEDRKKIFQSRIPAQASAMRKRFLNGMLDEEVEAARKHLEAVYRSQLEVGPYLTALDLHKSHPKYGFWLEGIHRHLDECEAALAEQPDAKTIPGSEEKTGA